MKKRVAIIGGGITGLAAAHRVRELNPDMEVLLFEAAHRVGVGHLERVASIEKRLQEFPNLALAGSSLHGVGAPA